MLTCCRESRLQLLWPLLLAILFWHSTSSAQTKVRSSQINLGDNSAFTGNLSDTPRQNQFAGYPLNNVRYVDGIFYPYTATGIQNCINDARTLGSGTGFCDARGVPSIALGTTEIDVGDGIHAVVLLLPTFATWTSAITNGTGCAIKQFNKTSIIGTTTAGSALFVLAPASAATNAFALYCTDPSAPGGGSYIHAEGMGITNTVGATMAKAAFVVQHLFDNTEYRDIFVSNTSGKGVVVADACCGTTFYNLTINGQYGSGAIPLVIGDSGIGGILSGGVVGVSFVNASVTHPGSGQNNIQISDSNFNENIQFDNLYMEPNNVDTKTALVQIFANAHNITFNGFNASGAWAALCTSYVVDVATWAGPSNDVFLNGKSGCTNASNIVNDHITGVQLHGAAAFGQAPAYISGTLIWQTGTEYCGATTGARQACAKTIQTAPLIVWGDVQLNTTPTQSITTLPFSDAFYSCTGSDLTTAAGIVSFNTYASSSVTIQETGGVNTDHLRYLCVGH
jgi:hypothetical protein